MPDGAALASWLRQRCGNLTASRMAEAVARLKSGKPSESRRRLMIELVGERLTGSQARRFVSDAMQWGIECQVPAHLAFEARTGILAEPCETFFPHPQIRRFGATPDGLIDDDGLIEIKCPTTTTFVEWHLAGVVPEEHRPQMLAQLACTGRAFCYFIAFDPRITSPELQLFVQRFEPSRAEIEAVETEAQVFLEELADLEAQFRMGVLPR